MVLQPNTYIQFCFAFLESDEGRLKKLTMNDCDWLEVQSALVCKPTSFDVIRCYRLTESFRKLDMRTRLVIDQDHVARVQTSPSYGS